MNIITKLMALCLVVFGITQFNAASSVVADDKEIIIIASEGAYAPFNYFDENGELAGFEIDLAKALCAQIGIKCKIVSQDWDGMIPGLLAKKYDAIMASMSITEVRQKKVLFSNPYYITGGRFVVHKDKAVTLLLGGLENVTIGVQRSTTHAQYLQDFHTGLRLKLYDTQNAANRDLVNGRIDAVLADSIVLQKNLLETDYGRDFVFLGPEILEPKSLFGAGVGVAFRQQDTELAERFNKAIDTLVKNGVYQQINDKYFPFTIYVDGDK